MWLLSYPGPHYYQLFCYIYQARNIMSNQFQTSQGRQQASLFPHALGGPMMWPPSSIKNMTRKGVTNMQIPLPSSSGPWLSGKDTKKEYTTGLLLRCVPDTVETRKRSWGGFTLAGPLS